MAELKMSLRLAAFACGALALVAPAFPGPGPAMVIVARYGDAVPGVGAITSIDELAVNDAGEWLLRVDTDAAVNDEVILGPAGQVVLREGDPLSPAPATLAAVGSLSLDAAGRSAWSLTLAGVPAEADSGLYLGTTPLLAEGAVSQAAGFAPGTVYNGFFRASLSDADQVLLRAIVDDPSIPGTANEALVLLTLDPGGGVLSETVIVKDGDILPGQSVAVVQLSTLPDMAALNNAGQVAFIADLGGLSSMDKVLYLDGTILAQEGFPSPVPGRDWNDLGVVTRLGLNDSGIVVHSGGLAGDEATDRVIIRDGALFKQEGSGFPEIAPYVITSFGFGPILPTPAGEVLWYGSWNDPSQAFSEALFIDETPLLRRGYAIVDSMTVTNIEEFQNSYTMSPSGRYILAHVILNSATRAIVLIDREGVRCATDWSGDGAVNSGDISSFLTSWLQSVSTGTLVADFNDDGAANSGDISAFLTAWLADVTEGGC